MLVPERRVFLFVGLVLALFVILVAVFELKEFLYPSYGSCVQVQKELREVQEKNIPLFFYKHQAEQFDKLCGE